ncbi:MAG: hypothetical protein M1477_04135 [Candidatus Thermoplasmatota archaeon]|nr:hypothetical protein [Candidatus Thermoplasmatota archaeon]MCL5990072.1 hypothetical protein [Candidatus Thermoplasmatota archaeon]
MQTTSYHSVFMKLLTSKVDGGISEALNFLRPEDTLCPMLVHLTLRIQACMKQYAI